MTLYLRTLNEILELESMSSDRSGRFPFVTLDSYSSTLRLAKGIILSVIAAVDEDYRGRISKATRAPYAPEEALTEALGDKVVWGRRRSDG